jgi:hypothetical protein
MDRARLGRRLIGEPILQTCEILFAAADAKAWPDLRREAAAYYVQRMLLAWLPQLIDGALSGDALKGVDQQEIRTLCFLLLRDAWRHSAALLRAREDDPRWVDELFTEVASQLEVPAERILDDGRAYEVSEVELGWAARLAAPLGLPAMKLFAAHASIVTGMAEELDGRQP